jgi:hypothetical protein
MAYGATGRVPHKRRALALAAIATVVIGALQAPTAKVASAAPPVAIGTVHGSFYPNPNNSGSLDTAYLTNPVFAQDFPVIDFNPPAAAQVNCSNSTGIDENTRPYTDVIPNSDGTCSTQPARSPDGLSAAGCTPPSCPGQQQPVTTDLSTFQAIFTANLSVASPGQITFNFYSDDGWMLGAGMRQGATDQPTYVSGSLVQPLALTPGQQLSVVGSYNVPSPPTQNTVTVSFPAAGSYPIEVDYTECCSGQLALVLGTSFGNPIPSVNPPFVIHPTFGIGFLGLIATVVPGTGFLNSSQDSATIDWGDGLTTAAVLSPAANGSPGISVFALTPHTYWTPGVLPMTITLTSNFVGGTESFNGSAVVASRYVAMGDSYASGEGSGWPGGQTYPNIPGCDLGQLYQDPSGLLYAGTTDHINGFVSAPPLGGSFNNCQDPGNAPQPYTGNKCHRSITAYSEVVERLLAIQGMTLQIVACSGATVNGAYIPANTLFGDQLHSCDACSTAGDPPQASALGPDVSLVTFTMGGNDMHFASLAKKCLEGSFIGDAASCVGQDNQFIDALGYDTTAGRPTDGVFSGSSSPITPGATLTNVFDSTQKLQGVSATTCPAGSPLAGTDTWLQACWGHDLHDALVLLYREIRQQAPGARMLAVGYPRWFPTGGGSSDCQHFTPFVQIWGNDRIQLLDSIIADAANMAGTVQYVNTYDVLNSHDECASPNPGDWTVDPTTHAVSGCSGAWINGISIEGGVLGAPELLHPNPCGHQAEGVLAAGLYQQGVAAQSNVANFRLPTTGVSTPIQFLVPTGKIGITVSALWSQSDGIQWRLVDPAGRTYPVTQSGPVYAIWTRWSPMPGIWTLQATSTLTGGAGFVYGHVSSAYFGVQALPPAGVVQYQSESCNIHILYTDCTASLYAVISNSSQARSRFQTFQWFGESGKPIGVGGSVSVKGSVPFRVILKTIGPGGVYRLTSFKVTCAVYGC